MRRNSISKLWLVVGLVACGGSDGISTNLEAVYSVSTWTRHLQACSAEGPSVAAQEDPFFYLKVESFPGGSLLSFRECVTVEQCQMLARDNGTIHLGQFAFEEGSDESGWRLRYGSAFASQGSCQGSIHEALLTSTGTMVKIEDRRFEAVPFPPDGAGECPDDKLEAAVAGQPCSELEVVTAAMAADF